MAKKKQISHEELINKAVLATRLSAQRETKDIYKATEKRLYAYPIIKMRIDDRKEEIEEVQTHGVRGKSKSITRFMRNGVRMSEDEIKEGVLQDLTAMVASDQKEVENIEKALKIIEGDPYFEVVKLKYFEGKNDDEIGGIINCDPRTARTHKSRLIQRLAVFLYGVEALG